MKDEAKIERDLAYANYILKAPEKHRQLEPPECMVDFIDIALANLVGVRRVGISRTIINLKTMRRQYEQ